jgi:hypothetical protein
VRPIYRTGVPLSSRCYVLYIFLTNISTEYFKHAAHSPFFSSNSRLFHNATFLVCTIYMLQTGVLKFKCKTRVPRGQRVKIKKKKKVSTSRPCANTVINFCFLFHTCYQILFSAPPLLSTPRPCANTVINFCFLFHSSYQILFPAPPLLSTSRPCATTLISYSSLCHHWHQIPIFSVLQMLSTSHPCATNDINLSPCQLLSVPSPLPTSRSCAIKFSNL